MRRVILFTLCLVFISVSAVWATDAPVPKSPEVLQLEMDVLQGQRAVMVSELNRYLLQVEFLRCQRNHRTVATAIEGHDQSTP